MESYLVWSLDFNEYGKENFEKGKEISKINIAKKLLKNKVSIDTICDSTGLSREDIERIKEESL